MKVVIIGAGGHARVIYEILKHDRNIEVVAFIDNIIKGVDEKIMGIPVLGDHSVIPKLIKEGVKGYIIGVGDNEIRAKHFDNIKNIGLDPINAIHPTSHIAYSAKIGGGVVIAAGATIGACVEIGNNVIVNTGTIIEHENIIEEHTHISSGTVLAGRVVVKKGAFIGAGATVKEYVTIGKNSIIGAGSVVLKDIADNVVAVGVPAKAIKMRNENEEIENE